MGQGHPSSMEPQSVQYSQATWLLRGWRGTVRHWSQTWILNIVVLSLPPQEHYVKGRGGTRWPGSATVPGPYRELTLGLSQTKERSSPTVSQSEEDLLNTVASTALSSLTWAGVSLNRATQSPWAQKDGWRSFKAGWLHSAHPCEVILRPGWLQSSHRNQEEVASCYGVVKSAAWAAHIKPLRILHVHGKPCWTALLHVNSNVVSR